MDIISEMVQDRDIGRLIGNHVQPHSNSSSVAEGHFCCFKPLGEGLLKVTGSHVHWKNDNNYLKTVLDRDVVTTGH